MILWLLCFPRISIIAAVLPIRRLSTLLIIIIALLSVGCAPTGGEPTPTLFVIPTLTPTITPPSTVQGFEPPTLTPLGTPVAPPTTLPTGIPTAIPAACGETEGQVIVDTFFSQNAGNEVRYRVYLPPCYEQTGRQYPVLYMLHGLGFEMDDRHWERLGLTEAADAGFVTGTLPPMIIVMPNGIDAQHDWDTGPYPEVIVQELVPLIESQYCTWNTRETRAIGGLSRGGYWAYWVAMRNTDLFARVGGHSAFFYDADRLADKNPNNLVDSVGGLETLTMYFDHGINDNLVNDSVADFVQRLQVRGLTPEYVINPTGTHADAYWADHTTDYLAFYSADWLRDASFYPTCEN